MDRKHDSTYTPQPSNPPDFVMVERGFIRDESLSKEARWVGVVLASYVASNGLAWPGKRTLRKKTGLGLGKLEGALAELAARKYLEHKQSRGRRGWFGGGMEYGTHGILHPRKEGKNENSPTPVPGSKNAGVRRLHGGHGSGRKRPKMRA